MPVDRSYIASFAYDPASLALFQALTQLANFSDALEAAAGVRVGAGGGPSAAPAPAPASWTIAAAQGHFLVAITNPASAGSTPLQHEIQSAASTLFDANSAVSDYVLGLGQTTVDIINPNLTLYWRLRSRTPGSAWNSWLLYANASGVAALNAGALRTS
jgi:hypothetical protein